MTRDEFTDSLPEDGGQYTFETDYAGRPPSIAIVETIAAIEGVSSTDIDFTLYEQLDPEALDTMFDDTANTAETAEGSTHVVAEFHIDDYTVEVTSEGMLTVNAPEDTE